MLHRERGILPSQAFYELHAWEVDLLVSGLKKDAEHLAKQERADRMAERQRG